MLFAFYMHELVEIEIILVRGLGMQQVMRGPHNSCRHLRRRLIVGCGGAIKTPSSRRQAVGSACVGCGCGLVFRSRTAQAVYGFGVILPSITRGSEQC